MSDEYHVSSLIVHGRPEQAPIIAESIAAIPGAEIHAVVGGKLVVTLETANESEIVARLDHISLLDGVMAATLVYHQVEPKQQEPE